MIVIVIVIVSFYLIYLKAPLCISCINIVMQHRFSIIMYIILSLFSNEMSWLPCIIDINPLNATGANMHQAPMLTDNHGSEGVKVSKLLLHTWFLCGGTLISN